MFVYGLVGLEALDLLQRRGGLGCRLVSGRCCHDFVDAGDRGVARLGISGGDHMWGTSIVRLAVAARIH